MIIIMNNPSSSGDCSHQQQEGPSKVGEGVREILRNRYEIRPILVEIEIEIETETEKEVMLLVRVLQLHLK